MSFRLHAPYDIRRLPPTLDTIQSWIVSTEQPVSVMMEETAVNSFNGILIAVVSSRPNDYSMVVASRSDNNETTVSREFVVHYEHNDYTPYTIQLSPDGEWLVSPMDAQEDDFVSADNYVGLEGLTCLMNTLRRRFLSTRKGVYSCFNDAVNKVKKELATQRRSLKLATELAVNACDSSLLGREWVLAVTQAALYQLSTEKGHD